MRTMYADGFKLVSYIWPYRPINYNRLQIWPCSFAVRHIHFVLECFLKCLRIEKNKRFKFCFGAQTRYAHETITYRFKNALKQKNGKHLVHAKRLCRIARASLAAHLFFHLSYLRNSVLLNYVFPLENRTIQSLFWLTVNIRFRIYSYSVDRRAVRSIKTSFDVDLKRPQDVRYVSDTNMCTCGIFPVRLENYATKPLARAIAIRVRNPPSFGHTETGTRTTNTSGHRWLVARPSPNRLSFSARPDEVAGRVARWTRGTGKRGPIVGSVVETDNVLCAG